MEDNTTPAWTGPKVPRDGSLGDAVLKLRKLAGPARRRAESDFIRKCEPIVARAADEFGRGLDVDDLKQAARIGLWLALQEYDPAITVLFHRFARWKIFGELAKVARSSRMVKGPPATLLSLDADGGDDDDCSLAGEVEAAVSAGRVGAVGVERCMAAVRELPTLHRAAVAAEFKTGDGDGDADGLAGLSGIARDAVVKSALARLRTVL